MSRPFAAARSLFLLFTALTASAAAQNNAMQSGVEPRNTTLSIEKINKRPLSATERAIKEYERLVASNPSDAIVLNNLGVLYFSGRRMFEAQSMIRKAASLAPKSAQIRTNLAVVLNKTYNPGLAIETLESVLAGEPDFHRARQVLCELYAQQERSGEALACYGALRGADKLDAVSASNYGTSLIANEELERAIELLRWADAKFPPDAGVKNGLGVALFRKKKYADAEKNLQKAVELEPRATQLRYNLAMAQMANNKRGAVLEQYNYLKTSNPELAGELYKIIFRDRVVSAAPRQ